MANIKLSTLLAGSNIAFLGRSEFTATAGQTTFNVTYTPPYVVVEQNGLTLAPSDYNATDGSQVILNVSSSVGDSIVITSYQPTSVADAVSTNRSINTNNTLSGGGTLASDLTFSVNTAAIVANTYLQTMLGDYTSNTYAQTTFVNNTYAQITFVNKLSASEQTIQPSIVVANTFVAEQGSPISTKTANTITLALTDNGKILRCTNASSTISVNIPTNASVAFPVGAEIGIINDSANNVLVSNNAGVTLRSKEGSFTIADRYTSASLKKLDTNEWILIGAIS